MLSSSCTQLSRSSSTCDVNVLCVLVVASRSPACHLGKPRHQLGDGDLEYSSDSKVFAKKGFKKGHLKLYPYGLIVKCSSPEKDKAKCLIETESGAWFVVQPPKVDFAAGMLVPFFWVGYTSTQSEATMEMSRGKLHKLSMPVIKNTSALKAGQQLLMYKPPVQQGQKRERETHRADCTEACRSTSTDTGGHFAVG